MPRDTTYFISLKSCDFEPLGYVIIVLFSFSNFQVLKEFLSFSEGEVRSLASIYATVVCLPSIAI